MWTAGSFYGRTFVVVLLLSAAQTTRVRPVGLQMGRPSGSHTGHGVADGNGPTGRYGYFGCLFSYAVCQDDEICVNDELFGSCQKIGDPIDRFRYSLRPDQLLKLEHELEELVDGGYKWPDVYTQCVLGNVLLAFELNQHYNSEFCKEKYPLVTTRSGSMIHDDLVPLEKITDLEPYQPFPNYDDDYDDGIDDDERMSLLDRGKVESPYFELHSRSLVDPENDQEGPFYDPERPFLTNLNGDEFVTVHKYQKNKKRKSLTDDLLWSADLPGQEETRTSEFLRSLSPRELGLLKQMMMRNYDSEYDVSDDKRNDYDDGGDGNSKDLDIDDDDGDERELLSQYMKNEATFEPDDDAVDTEPEADPVDTEATDYSDDDNLGLDDDYYDDRRFDLDDQGIFYPGRQSGLSSDNNDQTDQTLDVEGSDQSPSDEKASPDRTMPNAENIHEAGIDDGVMKQVEIRAAAAASTVVAATAAKAVRAAETLPKETGASSTDSSKAKYDLVDASYAYLSVTPKIDDPNIAGNIVTELQELLHLPPGTFSDLSVYKGDINFRISQNPDGLNASTVAARALSLSDEIKNRTGIQIVGAGVGHVSESYISVEDVNTNGRKYFLLTFVLCGVIAGVVLAVILLYVIRRHRLSKEKFARLAQSTEKVGPEASKEYQDLCRHRMQSKLSEKPEPLHVAGRVGSVSAMESAPIHSPSSRSSTSSWSEEPVTTSMDISTGHIILSYMEDHLKNKDRLDEEWEALCAYEPEISAVSVASLPQNERKNRYSDILPYDHSRVVLQSSINMTGSDYINASTIMDHDPRNPAYLITQGPLPNTVADFWQMVWEQGSVVIVNLTKLTEQGTALCHCYWPSEGSDLYHIYEVHLVSEHIWCEDYLVRSFYLKNLQTNETRTVTQFHFLTWQDMKIPNSSKALLDFRRKINKSYRGRSCPILVHCSDGAGRSGTYCLIDMVLNRMTKGAKEIDIAATLEHIRDQRMHMVKTKEQFQFVLATVAEEVHAILKALPQQ